MRKSWLVLVVLMSLISGCSSNSDNPGNAGDAICGNGRLEVGESCDGDAFARNDKTCIGWNASVYGSGNVSCNDDCTINYIECKMPYCGDGKVNSRDEQCDGDVFKDGIDACHQYHGDIYSGGTLKCHVDTCKVDVSECVKINKCNNGVLDDGELCDGELFQEGMTDCVELDDDHFAGGMLGCTDTCELDRTNCMTKCGNGTLDEGEACDGNVFSEDLNTCKKWIPGTIGALSCSSTCQVVVANCMAKHNTYCGDGIVNTVAEQCDGHQFLLDKTRCDQWNPAFESGIVGCKSDCTLDTRNCRLKSTCGDGIFDSQEEECDANKYSSRGMPELKCGDYDDVFSNEMNVKCTDCKIDISSCAAKAPVCGNGRLDDGEICDGMLFRDNLDSCADYNSEYIYGKVTCSPSCKIIETACVGRPEAKCGDGIVNRPEEKCDGSAFAGGINTCQEYNSIFYSSGQLKCTSECKYDLSECSMSNSVESWTCGNEMVDIDNNEECDNNDYKFGITTCQEYSSFYSSGELKCATRCDYNLSQCVSVDICNENQMHCAGNTLYKCTNGTWAEEKTCGNDKICDVFSGDCIENTHHLRWCAFHKIGRGAKGYQGYGRIALPSEKTVSDITNAYMACTDNIAEPMQNWDVIPATINENCQDCGDKKEFATSESYLGKSGKNYCTFVFNFGLDGFACPPQQNGAAGPIPVDDASVFNINLTRQFMTSTDCEENNIRCAENMLQMCISGRWGLIENCNEGKICSVENEGCILVN